MPAPTAYTEDDLAAFMLNTLGPMATTLGITATPSLIGDFGPMTEPVNDVLLDYGTADIATITTVAGITKLRALAKVHAWRLAKEWATSRYNMSDGSLRLDRGQLLTNIEKALAEAKAEAAVVGAKATLVVKTGRVRWTQDPYAPVDLEALE